MKRLLMIATVAILAVVFSGLLLAQSDIGTWKLNVAKSKYVNTQAPKNETRTVEPQGAGAKNSFEGQRRLKLLGYPPVTLMCRVTAGLTPLRLMMKSWPLGLRAIAASMAAFNSASDWDARSGARKSAASSWPRHI